MTKRGIGSLLARALAVTALALSLTLPGPAEAARPGGSWELPRPLPPRIALTASWLAGKTLMLEDKAGPFWVTLGEDGIFSFRDNGLTKPFRGWWWVDPLGRLCFTSTTYWQTGTCFRARGEGNRVEGAIPDTAPDQWFRMGLSPR
jgi:hypothetical protein